MTVELLKSQSLVQHQKVTDEMKNLHSLIKSAKFETETQVLKKVAEM